MRLCILGHNVLLLFFARIVHKVTSFQVINSSKILLLSITHSYQKTRQKTSQSFLFYQFFLSYVAKISAIYLPLPTIAVHK